MNIDSHNIPAPTQAPIRNLTLVLDTTEAHFYVATPLGAVKAASVKEARKQLKAAGLTVGSHTMYHICVMKCPIDTEYPTRFYTPMSEHLESITVLDS